MPLLSDFYDPLSQISQQQNRFMGMGQLDDPIAALQKQLYGKQQPLPDQLSDNSENDDSILNELANKGMSALQFVGESLDKGFGGRTVRGLLGGEGPAALAHLIPFSDSLGLTDSGLLGNNLLADKHDVPTGRQLLEQGGILDPKSEPGFDLGDIAGIGTEIALDPAAWISGGATALGKSAAGEIATKALGEAGLTEALTDRAGSLLKMGPREGAIRTSLSDLLAANPEAHGAMETAAGGSQALDAALAADEPLGALARLHVPFMPSVGMNIGTGERAASIAGNLDSLGEAIKYSGPGRTLGALFDYNRRGVLGKEGQIAREAATKATVRAAGDASDAFLPHVRALADAGLMDANGGKLLNDVFEGLQELPPEYAHLQPNIDAIKNTLAAMPPEYRELGMPLEALDSKYTKYLPRQIAEDFGNSKGGSLLQTGDKFQNARISEFDVPGGKNMMNDLSTDPFIAGPKRGAAGIQIADNPNVLKAKQAYEEAAAGLADGTVDQATVVLKSKALQQAQKDAVNGIAGDYILGKYFPDFDRSAYETAKKTLAAVGEPVADAVEAASKPTNIEDMIANASVSKLQQSYDKWQAQQAAKVAGPSADELAALQNTVDEGDGLIKQSRGLAQILSGRDQKLVDAATPMFSNHPLTDIGTRIAASAHSTTGTRGAFNFLTDYATQFGTDADSVPVKQVLNNMGLTYDTKPLSKAAMATVNEVGAQPQYIGALKNMADSISEKLGTAVRPDEVLNFRVPNDIAGDAARMVKTFQTPVAVKAVLNNYDQFQRWFKTFVTQPFAAFHGRNKMTGMVSDIIAGIKPSNLFANHKQATNLLQGEQEVKGLADSIPAFKGLSDAEATAKVAQTAAARGMFQGGQIARDINPLEEGALGSILPGMTPNTFKSMGKTFLPDVMNGVEGEGGLMGTVKSVLPHPAKAGMQLGNLVEDGNRIATYIGLLKQGWSEEAAAAKSLVVHGDYQHLTDFERSVMKRVIPFYSFTRKVLPNFINDVIQNPGGITAQAIRTENAFKQQTGFTPDYVGKGLAIPLGESAPGTMKYLTDSGIIPIENLNDLVKIGTSPLDTARQTGEALLGQTSPLIKGPLELMTGKQFYTDRDLRDLQTHFSMPGIAEQVIMNSPVSRVLSTVSKLGDDRKSVLEKGLNLLTGARTTDVNLDRARDIAARDSITDLLRTAPGAHMGTPNLYIDKDSISNLSPENAKLYQLYNGIGKRAQQQAALRRKANPAAAELPQ